MLSKAADNIRSSGISTKGNVSGASASGLLKSLGCELALAKGRIKKAEASRVGSLPSTWDQTLDFFSAALAENKPY